MSNAKCILLYSGGLDSLLAAKLLMDQGVDVTGLHCILPYSPPDLDVESLRSVQLAKQIGLKLIHYRCGEEYIRMLQNPAHGYGKEINPCIDCKLFFLEKARELMDEIHADFIATGEVVGQRPMSQLKHTLNHIEKISGIAGKLLRPLSAKILKPTLAEEEGLVDRSRLLDISGRGRKRQMELAAYYGINNYELPAGGCLFTDKNIASRIRELFSSSLNISPLDLYLTKTGRHFKLNGLRIIVSRNEAESDELEKYRQYADYFFYPEYSGSSAFAKGQASDNDFMIISGIMSRYGKPGASNNIISVYHDDILLTQISAGEPLSDVELDAMRI